LRAATWVWPWCVLETYILKISCHLHKENLRNGFLHNRGKPFFNGSEAILPEYCANVCVEYIYLVNDQYKKRDSSRLVILLPLQSDCEG
jgi:hypothetical protein